MVPSTALFHFEFATACRSVRSRSSRDVLKGHANKMIARTLDIAEATVKVHLKSVLRKIRVANRTQAAIWALENGYGTERPASRAAAA